jgi:hypothetical protein
MMSPKLEGITIDFYRGSSPILAELGSQDPSEHGEPEPLKM